MVVLRQLMRGPGWVLGVLIAVSLLVGGYLWGSSIGWGSQEYTKKQAILNRFEEQKPVVLQQALDDLPKLVYTRDFEREGIPVLRSNSRSAYSGDMLGQMAAHGKNWDRVDTVEDGFSSSTPDTKPQIGCVWGWEVTADGTKDVEGAPQNSFAWRYVDPTAGVISHYEVKLWVAFPKAKRWFAVVMLYARNNGSFESVKKREWDHKYHNVLTDHSGNGIYYLTAATIGPSDLDGDSCNPHSMHGSHVNEKGKLIIRDFDIL